MTEAVERLIEELAVIADRAETSPLNASMLRDAAAQLSRLSAEKAALEKEVAELKAAKWAVKHTDTMNDLVQMGMARDDAVAKLAEARGALEATKAVIEGGGGRIGLAKKGLRIVCVHGVPELEDCIGCYDEALLAALDLTAEQGEE